MVGGSPHVVALMCVCMSGPKSVDGAERDLLTILALNAKPDLFSSLWAGGPSRSWVSSRGGDLALGLIAPEPPRLEVMGAFPGSREGRLFHPRVGWGPGQGWGSPWRAWPQICYPLRTVAGMGLAQKLRTGDGHGSGRESCRWKGISKW